MGEAGGGAGVPASSPGGGTAGGAPTAAPGTGAGSSGATSSPVAPVTADTFGWDSWDGAAFDAFPAEARPWVERVAGHFGPKLREAEQNADLVAYLKEVGGTDSEAAKFAEERTAWGSERSTLQAELDRHRASITDYEAKVAAYEAAQAERDLAEQQAWITANQEWLDQPGARTAVAALLGPEPAEGAPDRISLDRVAEVVKLGQKSGDLKKVVDVALELLDAGVPADGKHFLRLLQMEVGGAAAQAPAATPAPAAPAPAPRPTADLTGDGVAHAGASGRPPAPRGLQGISTSLSQRFAAHQRQ